MKLIYFFLFSFFLFVLGSVVVFYEVSYGSFGYGDYYGGGECGSVVFLIVKIKVGMVIGFINLIVFNVC